MHICICIHIYMFKNKKNTNHINNSSWWFLSVHFWRRFSHPKPQGKKGDLMNSSPRSDLILPWNDYSQITCWEWEQLGWIHPGRFTWNLRIHPWKRKIIFQTLIFRFYVNLPGCMFHPLRAGIATHHHTLTALDIECSGGRDIKALSKKQNFQWPYTPETNGSHLPGGQSPKGNFLFQPKWGAKYWYYWFQGGYSTVLANQLFADEMIPPITKERLTHLATFIQFCSFQSVKEPTKTGGVRWVLGGWARTGYLPSQELMKNLEFWTHKSTRQPKPWAISPPKNWGKHWRKRKCTYLYRFIVPRCCWLMPSNHMNLL